MATFISTFLSKQTAKLDNLIEDVGNHQISQHSISLCLCMVATIKGAKLLLNFDFVIETTSGNTAIKWLWKIRGRRFCFKFNRRMMSIFKTPRDGFGLWTNYFSKVVTEWHFISKFLLKSEFTEHAFPRLQINESICNHLQKTLLPQNQNTRSAHQKRDHTCGQRVGHKKSITVPECKSDQWKPEKLFPKGIINWFPAVASVLLISITANLLFNYITGT